MKACVALYKKRSADLVKHRRTVSLVSKRYLLREPARDIECKIKINEIGIFPDVKAKCDTQ